MSSIEGQRDGAKSLPTSWPQVSAFHLEMEARVIKNRKLWPPWGMCCEYLGLSLPERLHEFLIEGPTQEGSLPTVRSLRKPQDLNGRLLPEKKKKAKKNNQVDSVLHL